MREPSAPLSWEKDVWRQVKRIVAEMESAGVEPNLTTYTRLLGIAWPPAGDLMGNYPVQKYPASRLVWLR